MDNNVVKYMEHKDKTVSFFKNRIFDFIAVFTVLVMSLLSLSALELRDITFKNLVDIFIESFPFYFAATMLSRNYYTKGAYLGKAQDSFKNAVKYYSEYVIKLTGKDLRILPKFCNDYNDRALKSMQEATLHSVALTMEKFHEYDDKVGRPLKVVEYKHIRKVYGREVALAVQKCKRIKIKGISPNSLLSNLTNSDSTDLGYSEKELMRRRTASYAVTYAVSIIIMSLIAIKDIIEWGWKGVFLTLFKLSFVVGSACLRYFEGYEDITINVVDYLFRKSDVLKEFEYWRNVENEPISE